MARAFHVAFLVPEVSEAVVNRNRIRSRLSIRVELDRTCLSREDGVTRMALDLGWNSRDASGQYGLGVAGAVNLAAAMAVVTVESLDLAGCNLGSQAMEPLARALPTCNQLALVDLDSNALGDEAATLIAEALPSCASPSCLLGRWRRRNEGGPLEGCSHGAARPRTWHVDNLALAHPARAGILFQAGGPSRDQRSCDHGQPGPWLRLLWLCTGCMEPRHRGARGHLFNDNHWRGCRPAEHRREQHGGSHGNQGA